MKYNCPDTLRHTVPRYLGDNCPERLRDILLRYLDDNCSDRTIRILSRYLDDNKNKQKQTPWPLVRERTIPTERPPLVDEI
jgi:hypothetical protein